MTEVNLGGTGEFDIIRSILSGVESSPGVIVGPGDDAVVLEGGVVISSDISVEDVHFRTGWLTSREIGYRAAAAALSDLAAMAAEPVGVLASLAIPIEVPSDDGDDGDDGNDGDDGVDEDAENDGDEGRSRTPGDRARWVMEGVKEAVEVAGGVLLGGDLSSSPGPLVLDVTAVGRADQPILRLGAGPGDAVWVTGVLGAAAGAVRIWDQGRAPSSTLRTAFARPVPRAREALWLRGEAKIHALIDISDGIAGDAGHLAAAGGVRVVVEEEALPIHPGLDAPAVSGGRDAHSDVPLHLALFGGEDYELLFAAADGSVEPVAEAFTERFGIALTRIGRVEEGSGAHLLRPSGEESALVRGYSHFASASDESASDESAWDASASDRARRP